jgi:predicted Zn-dependent peptidase
LLEHPEQTKTIPSPYTVDNFISDPVLKQFYMYDMNTVLEQYEPGRPEHKPKLLEQMRKMEEERAKRLDDHNKMLQSQQKILSLCSPINQDLEKLRNDYEKKISDKNLLISELLKKIKQITIELDELKHLKQSNK